ncbi:hypothetical protein ACK08B_21265 [Pantoea dispersa]|uniref:hypothetical protein n=1 Tax=Pantoea dispersa TaxID=59814 RepID=UPI003989C535
MLTLSPVWHGRLRAARGLTNLLMQTLVIHPALLFFLLFLLSAHQHAGGAGQMLLDEAEKLVRDAPAGQVWGCVSQARPLTAFPPAPLSVLREEAPVPDALKPDPTPVMCEKAAVSREAWAAEASSTLLLLYRTAVVLSVISNLAVWHLRRRAKGEHA